MKQVRRKQSKQRQTILNFELEKVKKIKVTTHHKF